MIGIDVLHTTLTLTLKLEAWSSKLEALKFEALKPEENSIIRS